VTGGQNPDAGDGDRGRVLYAALHLLDHQLLDRTEYRCGKVDDLELAEQEDGSLVVTHVLAGPGVLAERLDHHRFGPWWRRATHAEEAVRIPMRTVQEIGADVLLGVDAHDLATSHTERWARERIVDHLPGSDTAARSDEDGE
jgi:hypothetical protein